MPLHQQVHKATMDADAVHYFLASSHANTVTTSCGDQLTSDTLPAYYVMAASWQNTCLWTVPVPAYLDELYIGVGGELRFRGWFEQPLQLADTLFELEAGAIYIDGRVDPVLGLYDGQVVARAKYQFEPQALFGMIPRHIRALDHLERPVLVVNFSDSLRVDDSLFVTTGPITMVATMDQDGSLLNASTIGQGVMGFGSLASDPYGNLYLGGLCHDDVCTVHDSILDMVFPGASYVARIPANGGSTWVHYEPWSPASYPAQALVVGGDRIVAGYAHYAGSGGSSSVIQLDSTGTATFGPYGTASSWSSTGVPLLTVDVEGNIVAVTGFVGSNPDQRIHCFDPQGELLWMHELTAGGNLFYLRSFPVGVGTHLFVGWAEGGIPFGPHVAVPPLGSPFSNNYLFAKLGDFSVGQGRVEQPQGVLEIWPNPVHERLSVRTNCDAEITVHDAMGRIIVRERPSSDPHSMDTGAWPSGLYTLRTACGSIRVIKE